VRSRADAAARAAAVSAAGDREMMDDEL